MESNLGKWDRFYVRIEEGTPPSLYGDQATYRIAAEWLEPAGAIEDWGCGRGGMRKFWDGEYLGVDGSASPFADVVADLVEYRSSTPGLLLRHVLEHDLGWETILDNAIASFTQRMVLVLFTPVQPETHVLKWIQGYRRVPDIGFAPADIEARFDSGVRFELQTIDGTGTDYGSERVYLLER